MPELIYLFICIYILLQTVYTPSTERKHQNHTLENLEQKH